MALAQPQAATADALLAITIPAGARIEVALIRPVWAQSASPGVPVYAQTTFPVTVGNRMAIPPGSYVQGRIEQVTRPTRRSNRAEFQILFTKIILANGYALALADGGVAGSGPATGPAPAPAETLIDVTAQVSAANDLLLDNGAQIEMTLASPLSLDAKLVVAAVSVSRAIDPGQFKSATLCRSVQGSPGTQGTPDTVVPGSPGTPDTVIPGGPGMADIVIAGTPATPSITIPGSPGFPGTPGYTCPSAPMVISSKPVTAQKTATQNSLPAATH